MPDTPERIPPITKTTPGFNVQGTRTARFSSLWGFGRPDDPSAVDKLAAKVDPEIAERVRDRERAISNWEATQGITEKMADEMGREVDEEIIQEILAEVSEEVAEIVNAPEPPPEPFAGFKWRVETPLDEPSAVDRLAAVEDPEGEAGQRCREHDKQQERLSEDAARIKELLNAPERKRFIIDVNNPECYASEVQVDEDEDGNKRYLFGVQM
jgi:hypothetical protein